MKEVKSPPSAVIYHEVARCEMMILHFRLFMLLKSPDRIKFRITKYERSATHVSLKIHVLSSYLIDRGIEKAK